MRIVRYAALLAVLAGCYSPLAQEGAPCAGSDSCPSPQRCVVGRCSLHDASMADASPPEPDASPDAPVDAPPLPIDAMRLPCSATGLACSVAPMTFMCGGNCWVVCTGNVQRETARAACAGWMGVLGEINDPTENGCVAPHVVGTAAWIGLSQSPTATRPGDGWTWNGTTSLVYTNWLSGKPDDGDNNESGAEQCASMRPNGTWDDDACTNSLDFFCERP